MKKRTQNKLRRIFYGGKAKPLFFTAENMEAANTLVLIVRRLFGCEKNKSGHKHKLHG